MQIPARMEAVPDNAPSPPTIDRAGPAATIIRMANHPSSQNTNGEPMTVDDLARTTQDEFIALRAEMPNKEDVGRIIQAISDLDLHFSATASSWRQDFE